MSKYIALALDEDQCRAVMGACAAASEIISRDLHTYERVLAGTGKTPFELTALYASIVLYVSDKLEEETKGK